MIYYLTYCRQLCKYPDKVSYLRIQNVNPTLTKDPKRNRGRAPAHREAKVRDGSDGKTAFTNAGGEQTFSITSKNHSASRNNN